MSRVFTLQFSSVTDNLFQDPSGELHEGTRKPYPFYVRDNGHIERQDIWRGRPKTAIGFAKRLEVHQVDIRWADILDDPQQAVGTYLITRDADGKIGTHQSAVESIDMDDDGDIAYLDVPREV